MSEAGSSALDAGTGRFRGAAAQALAVFCLAAVFYAGLSYQIAAQNDRSIGELAVFFDGHLYLSIARSFPVPYSEQALDYAGHAPGFPAFAWLAHAMTPDSLVDWGVALMIAVWLPAAAAVALFFLAARKLEASPWLPTLAFAVANPGWLLSATTPHAEPLAIALLLAALLAHLNGRFALAGLALSLAVLTRYPSAVLGAWLFLGIFASSQFRLRPQIIHAFGSLAAFGLISAYLYWRIPEFQGISHAHAVFWNTGLIVPFSGLLLGIGSELWTHPTFEVTYGIFGLYVAAVVAALASRDRHNIELVIWLLLTAGAAASFRGILGLWDFPRLSIPAWPAALLILARCSRQLRSRVAALAAVGACSALCAGAAVGLWLLLADNHGPYVNQPAALPWLNREMAELDRAAPRWVNFRKFHRDKEAPVHDPNRPPEPTR